MSDMAWPVGGGRAAFAQIMQQASPAYSQWLSVRRALLQDLQHVHTGVDFRVMQGGLRHTEQGVDFG